MKKFGTIIILSLISFGGFSQSPFGASKKHKKKFLYIELMGGAVLPSMNFSGTSFDDYTNKWYSDKTGGIAFRFQCYNFFSVSAQVAYSGQGVRFPDNNDYKLTANYLNLFIPLEFSFNLYGKGEKSGLSMLLFAGPYLARNIGGHIVNETQDIDLTKNEINPFDYGVESGWGLRIPTYSLNSYSNFTFKISYYQGIANSFPEKSDYNSTQMSDLMLSDTGSRFNRGFKITLTYGILLGKKKINSFTAGGDGERTYKKFLVQ